MPSGSRFWNLMHFTGCWSQLPPWKESGVESGYRRTGKSSMALQGRPWVGCLYPAGAQIAPQAGRGPDSGPGGPPSPLNSGKRAAVGDAQVALATGSALPLPLLESSISRASRLTDFLLSGGEKQLHLGAGQDRRRKKRWSTERVVGMVRAASKTETSHHL